MGGGEGDQDLGDDSVDAESAEPGEIETPADRPSGPSRRGRRRRSRGGGRNVGRSMPEMGESVTEGTVLEWHVEEGQQVAEGDTVIEVSTDKVDAEVPAPAAGTITKLLVKPDDTVQVGQALAEMTAGRPRDGAAAARG